MFDPFIKVILENLTSRMRLYSSQQYSCVKGLVSCSFVAYLLSDKTEIRVENAAPSQLHNRVF